MIVSLFSLWRKKSPETRFWAWFEKHQDMLLSFERDQEGVFDKLKTAMSKVHPELTFEFGPDKDGKRELVISAGGMIDGFPAVEALYASAPSLPRWTLTKFRPRGGEAMTIEMGDLILESKDIKVAIKADGDKAGLTVFVEGFDESEAELFTDAAFLVLDHSIGEYDMGTRVGFIEVKPAEQESERNLHGLNDLPRVFDKFFKNKRTPY